MVVADFAFHLLETLLLGRLTPHTPPPHGPPNPRRASRRIAWNCVLPEYSIHSQPFWAVLRRAQKKRKTAPGKTPQGRISPKQMRANGIQVHVIASGAQISIAAAF